MSVDITILPPNSPDWSVSDLMEQLGNIPPQRVRLTPPPGTATEADLLKRSGCELIDGTLVEKAMGAFQGRVEAVLIFLLETYLAKNPIGAVLSASGMIRFGSRVRLPDVSFIRWDRLPGDEMPSEPAVLDVTPDLVVEVLSPGNTPEEMFEQRRDYFGAGTRLVWEIDPDSRSVRVFTGVEESSVLGEAGTLEGRDVLPGFTLGVRRLFEQARHGNV